MSCEALKQLLWTAFSLLHCGCWCSTPLIMPSFFQSLLMHVLHGLLRRQLPAQPKTRTVNSLHPLHMQGPALELQAAMVDLDLFLLNDTSPVPALASQLTALSASVSLTPFSSSTLTALSTVQARLGPTLRANPSPAEVFLHLAWTPLWYLSSACPRSCISQQSGLLLPALGMACVDDATSYHFLEGQHRRLSNARRASSAASRTRARLAAQCPTCRAWTRPPRMPTVSTALCSEVCAGAPPQAFCHKPGCPQPAARHREGVWRGAPTPPCRTDQVEMLSLKGNLQSFLCCLQAT